MGNKVWRYLELERIQHLPNEGRGLLGHYIYWTEKRDGSCLAVWLRSKSKKRIFLNRLLRRSHNEDYDVMVSSRNREVAEKSIRNDFKRASPEAENVLQFLYDYPSDTVFGELLRQGLSPTRMEDHGEKVEWVVFDISDGTKFLNYQQVHQTCFHYGMKCVRLFGEGIFIRMESLYDYRDKMLELCKEEKREGVVLKTLTNEGKPIYTKEKLDVAQSRGQPKLERGQPLYPPLPLSEALGAVDKAYADLGVEFAIKKTAMPLVAKYIREEMKKHMCTSPEYDYYRLYCDYCREHGIVEQTTNPNMQTEWVGGPMQEIPDKSLWKRFMEWLVNIGMRKNRGE